MFVFAKAVPDTYVMVKVVVWVLFFANTCPLVLKPVNSTCILSLFVVITGSTFSVSDASKEPLFFKVTLSGLLLINSLIKFPLNVF